MIQKTYYSTSPEFTFLYLEAGFIEIEIILSLMKQEGKNFNIYVFGDLFLSQKIVLFIASAVHKYILISRVPMNVTKHV